MVNIFQNAIARSCRSCVTLTCKSKKNSIWWNETAWHFVVWPEGLSGQVPFCVCSLSDISQASFCHSKWNEIKSSLKYYSGCRSPLPSFHQPHHHTTPHRPTESATFQRSVRISWPVPPSMCVSLERLVVWLSYSSPAGTVVGRVPVKTNLQRVWPHSNPPRLAAASKNGCLPVSMKRCAPAMSIMRSCAMLCLLMHARLWHLKNKGKEGSVAVALSFLRCKSLIKLILSSIVFFFFFG